MHSKILADSFANDPAVVYLCIPFNRPLKQERFYKYYLQLYATNTCKHQSKPRIWQICCLCEIGKNITAQPSPNLNWRKANNDFFVCEILLQWFTVQHCG